MPGMMDTILNLRSYNGIAESSNPGVRSKTLGHREVGMACHAAVAPRVSVRFLHRARPRSLQGLELLVPVLFLRLLRSEGRKTMAANRRSSPVRKAIPLKPSEIELGIGLKRLAHDQIIRHIEKRFSGHALAHLVGAVLRAQGFQTEVAGPGPDGGVDILATRGPLGFEGPYICVQVKSSKHPEDVVTLRALQGAMTNFKAHQGLLVAWGGFTKALLREARNSYFQLRLWSSKDLVEAMYLNYDLLPADMKSELRIEQVWVLTT